MDSGEEIEGVEGQRKKKRYHRHTPRQIQELEAVFKECPHPDEKQRMQLSRDLNLEPRQIKFWFQNRRTQMKAQHERADNCALRAENDKIRCENIAIREALKKIMCPTCGTPPVAEDSYFDEQKLRMENARLKEELDRVSTFASKYLGRPITQLPPVQPIPVSSLDLSVGGYSGGVCAGGVHSGLGPSLNLDLLPGSSSSVLQLAYPGAVSDLDKPALAELATNAMEELIRMAQTDQPLWMKPGVDEPDVLNLETYERIFSRPGQQFKSPDTRVEASRDSNLVFMNAETMVEIFIDPMRWAELFSTIVSRARIVEVLAGGIGGSRSGSLMLMHEELQVLSPVVPKREFVFLRYFQQIEQGLWAIADVSVDLSRDGQFTTSRTRKLPSGCLIHDMPNGYSKVTWIEHMEIEDENSTHNMYRELVESGAAYGAQRWLATLQRMCERFACLMVIGSTPEDIGGVLPTPEGKRSMMKLAQRMVTNFCTSLSASGGHQWTSLSGLNEVGVRVSVHKSSDPGQPNGVVLSAATSIWLPVSSDTVFSFFKDEHTRAQWDVLSNGNTVQEVAHITNGSHPGNCISLLRAFNASQNNMLILQESCTDASGSLVVYAPVDLQGINVVMSGEDPSYVPLLPSGFAILPDGRAGGASTSSTPMVGSLITVAFQILVSSLPSAKLSAESVNTVNNLISTTVQQIKAGLNCSSL